MNLGRAPAPASPGTTISTSSPLDGDANFMPIVGGTRVFIEDLDTTYRRLRPLFERERARRERAGRGGKRPIASPFEVNHA